MRALMTRCLTTFGVPSARRAEMIGIIIWLLAASILYMLPEENASSPPEPELEIAASSPPAIPADITSLPTDGSNAVRLCVVAEIPSMQANSQTLLDELMDSLHRTGIRHTVYASGLGTRVYVAESQLEEA